MPLVWLFISSTKSLDNLFSSFGLWFSGFNLFDNISETFSQDGGVFWTWLRNTLMYAVVSAVGAALLAAGVGLVALGIVKGPDWGWESARVLASIAAGLVLLPLVIMRSARHPAPVIELGLFRSRSFAVANVGMLSFSSAFYALLLANILFTTQIWGWSVLQAGVAITPAPAMAALSAPVAGLLSDRFGQRVVALPAALLFAAGCLYLASAMDVSSDYATELLPAQLLTGTGVGLSFAAWGSAAVAGLAPERFATGSAVLACLRQIGAVLGIAVLVALLEGSTADPLGGFHDAWRLMAATGLVTGAIALALGRVRAVAAPPVRSADPAEPATADEHHHDPLGLVHR
jgi:hypothetical protein